MLRDIGRELQAELARRGCPFTVVDGPEPTGTVSFARERIVIEHEGGDVFRPVKGAHPNPKCVQVRGVAAKVSIYARAGKANATTAEHRDRAEQVLDLVVVGLSVVAQERRQPITFLGGGFFVPEGLEKSAVHGGAAYALKVDVARGVFDRKWTGEARPTHTLVADQIETTDEVRDPSHPTPETAC